MKKSILFTAVAALMTLTMSSMSFAADYPSEDITLIVPFAAGGNTDLLARKAAELLPKYLPNEVNVHVENISEGGNVPGTTEVYNAEPDGYTLGVFGQGPMSTTPLTVETPYTYEDFTPICEVSSFSPEIAVKADSDYQTLDDLLTAIKENPGTITYASQSAFCGRRWSLMR